jgi:hypothetical protein
MADMSDTKHFKTILVSNFCNRCAEKGSGFVEKDELLLQKQHTKLGPSGPKIFLQHSPFAEN